ncbi:MAG TPA: DoxX family protein [Gemmatimonadales bacterium]|nr:DoxX family protein [Gemmatimonadales bacterium]
MTPTTQARTTTRFDAGLTVLRAAVGSIFLVHGAQKLFVYGFAGVAGAFGQMGVPLPGVTGPMVALIEFFGGAALLIGLLTRLAGLGLALTMTGAIMLVHLKGGFFNPNGFEYPLALAAASLAVALIGGGRFSVDAVLMRRQIR